MPLIYAEIKKTAFYADGRGGENRTPISGFGDRCTAIVRHPYYMVTRTGFEPVNAAVKGRCVKPLHQRAIIK